MKTNPDLWKKLETMRFEQDEVPFGFANRLARDNDWSLSFSERVIEEYKKFVYLAMVAGHEVTPSDEVDQVWHLHLTYTRHYWGSFTGILGKPLHHGPTQGTDCDKVRFDDNYAQTKASYKAEFGELPPEDIWPSAEVRFGTAPFYQRVNTKAYWLIKMPSAIHRFRWPRSAWLATALGGSGLIGLSLAHAQSSSTPDEGGNSLILIGMIIAVVLGIGLVFGRKRNATKRHGKSGAAGTGCSGAGKSPDGGDGGSGCSSGCGGGCGGG